MARNSRRHRRTESGWIEIEFNSAQREEDFGDCMFGAFILFIFAMITLAYAFGCVPA